MGNALVHPLNSFCANVPIFNPLKTLKNHTHSFIGDGAVIGNHDFLGGGTGGGGHNKLKCVINFAKIRGHHFPFIRNLRELTISALKIVTIFSLLFPFHLLLT